MKPMSGGTTSQLTDAARSGSREAFEALLRPLIEPGCQLAFGILGDWQEAEDAVQEAAYKAWMNIGRLREGTTSLRPWFFTIIRNHCLSVRRGRWFSVVRRADLGLTAGRTLDEDASRHLDLQRALKELNPNQRLVLLLHYYLDLPLAEVTPILGISAGGAKSLLYRALAKMRPNLDRSEVTI
jgi:RNA polymerase sigma-70 factor (ECF subfamily)